MNINKKSLIITFIIVITVVSIQVYDNWVSSYIGANVSSSDPKVITYKHRDKFEFSKLQYWIKTKCTITGGSFYWCGNEYTCQDSICTRECSSPICAYDDPKYDKDSWQTIIPES